MERLPSIYSILNEWQLLGPSFHLSRRAGEYLHKQRQKKTTLGRWQTKLLNKIKCKDLKMIKSEGMLRTYQAWLQLKINEIVHVVLSRSAGTVTKFSRWFLENWKLNEVWFCWIFHADLGANWLHCLNHQQIWKVSFLTTVYCNDFSFRKIRTSQV